MTGVDRDRADSLSVPEMLRIMDVATALRQDRELVEEQLDVEALKGRLKERMIAASKVTGESVTPEEVDAAIRQYFASLYTFREPKLSVSVALAHLWVRRVAVFWAAWAAIVVVTMVWWLYLSPTGPLTARGRNHARVEKLAAEVDGRSEVVRKLARDASVGPEVARLAVEAGAYRERDDPEGLASVLKSLAEMESRLNEAYAVTVVSGANHKSAIDRYFTDRQGKRASGYYLIVEARRPDGTALARRIRNDETGSTRDVTTWAERVPEAVYRRLKKDKLDDGILDETAFAVKRKGRLDEEITMSGPDGKPLTRLGQITEW